MWLSRPTVIEPVATNVPSGRSDGAIDGVGVAAVGLGMGVGWPVSGAVGPSTDAGGLTAMDGGAAPDGPAVVPVQPVSDKTERPNAA